MEQLVAELLKPFYQLFEDTAFIKEKIISLQNPETDKDVWLGLNQLRNYLSDRPAAATIYKYVAQNTIPYHKDKKKLRFLKSEIDAWLLKGGSKSKSTVSQDTDSFLTSYKRKGGKRA